MNEIFSDIDANAARAKERERAEAEAAERSWAEYKAKEAQRQKLRHRRADLGLALRLAFSVLFTGVLWRITAADAIQFEVTTGLLILWFTYIGFYAGVWWHYRFGKGWGALWL